MPPRHRPVAPVRALACASLFALLAASPASAQDGHSDPDADTITVSARLPPPPAARSYGGETIDGATLNATASGRIEEALARIPGFQQFRRSDSRSANPSAQGITLRAIGGNAASRTLLLLDGVPQADAFFGFIPFTALPSGQIASATVTRGAGVGPFGAGAVAGVIELASVPAAERAPLSVAAVLGSRDSGEFVLAASAPLGAGHIAVEARHDRGDGFQTTPADQRGPASVPSRYRGTSAALLADLPLGTDWTLTPRLAAFRDTRTLRFAGADSSAEGIDASLRLATAHADPARWQVEALGWVQARDFSNIVVSAASLRPTLDQRSTPTSGWGGKIELRPPSPAWRVTRIGADVRGSAGRAIEDARAASGARTATRRSGGHGLIAGAFAEQDILLGDLALTGGARIDHWRLTRGFADEARANGSIAADSRFAPRSGTIASFRGGAAWTLSPALTLRGAAYTGWRLPTLNELYRPFVVFPVTTAANAALRPERLRGAELGLAIAPAPGLSLSLTAFDNRLADAIANVTLSGNARQRQNVRAIRARGIEAATHVERGAWRIDGGYAYSDARVDAPGTAIDDERPAQTPRHSASLTIGWVPRADALLQLGLRHVGGQYEDDRGADRLPPATTLDALATLPVGGNWQLSLRGENLTDTRIVTRNVAGSIDLGTPRTLWLGLRWTG